MQEVQGAKIYYDKNNYDFSLEENKNTDHYFFIDKDRKLSLININNNLLCDVDLEIEYIRNNISLQQIYNLRLKLSNRYNFLKTIDERIIYFKLVHRLLDILYSHNFNYDKLLILCDLDGTLSKARCKVDQEYLWKIYKIIESTVVKSNDLINIQFGILTGSDANFISQQIDSEDIEFKCTFFPCNGTQQLWSNNIGESFEYLNFSSCELDLQDFIGDQKYYDLLNYLLQKQIEVMSLLKEKDIYCTGNFISNRGLTLNMCPMGRDGLCSERRKLFINNDGLNIRMKIINEINEKFSDANIIAVLGGDTSIDIYPRECGKEFVLMTGISLTSNVYFIGDRIHEHGNDHSIYKILEKTNMSSGTKDPADTLLKIRNALNMFL